jgi:hypothetical protein
MFKEYERFRLCKPIPNEAIPVGKIGVVLVVYHIPHLAYEVEFVDPNGRNLGSVPTFTLTEDFMEAITD